MTSTSRLVAVACAWIFVSGAAHADSTSEARTHYQNGNAAFALGDFKQAAAEYELAYRLRQDPALLFNAAQAQRLGGNREKALIMYKNFVRLYPDNPNATEAQAQIEKLKTAIDADEKAKTSPPTSTVESGDKSLTGSAPAPEPAAAAPAAASPSAERGPAAKRPLYKRWWLWTGVAVVVAAAVVIPTAIVASKPAWTDVQVGPGAAHALFGISGRF